MKFDANINGIDVIATYSEDDIKNVFKPLLSRLVDLHKAKGSRILVMLAAPPGAGKSTLASFLEYYSKEACPNVTLQAIGMDGFHRKQEYLLSHETEVDGEMIPMVRIKGAPVTFDFDALKAKICRVLEGGDCGWPGYDRHLHNPVEDAVIITGDIIVLEGNYLLLDMENWRELHKLADYTVFLSADAKMLRNRLVDRKEASGNTREKAEAFVDFSDMRNVRLCLEQSLMADLELFTNENGSFKIVGSFEEVSGPEGETDEKSVREKYKKLTETLIQKNITITTMESCTSGQIASLLTDTEGSSAIIKGACITYSNEAKIMEGVPKETIERFGVYSPETSRAMARACRKKYGADLAVGVTGSFGNVDPNNPDSIPGEVYFSIVTGETARSFHCLVPTQKSRLDYKLYMADVIVECINTKAFGG